MQHLINRQTIHILLSKGADGFQMQQQMSGHYWRDILPVMASVFDELTNNDEIIRIDRLELDLGVLSEKDINQSSWEDTILEVIRKQLYEKIGGKKRSPWVIREPTGISASRQWLFYMQKGYLPWNSTEVNDAWYNVVLETLAVDYASVSELIRLIQADPVVAHRIVAQHNVDFLVKLIEILTAQRQQNLPGIVDVLDKMFLQAKASALAGSEVIVGTQRIWLLLFREVTGSERQLSSQNLVERILRRYWSGDPNFYFPDKENALVTDIILPVIERLKKEAGQFTPLDKEIDSDEKVFVADTKKETDKIENIDQGIYLQDAGVVLLHPFLTSLFRRLQLVKEGKFENEQAQQKALYLIHYMATGQVTAEEYELPMAKVLCAWPLEIPVDKNIILSTDELNETDAMLGAAIEQWTVLKNTSATGLREGFLRRRGKLFTENDKLYLRVEAQSIDVLLDQLPWVLSMIKLPWMKELLRVEWR
jgi:hypothetical protein